MKAKLLKKIRKRFIWAFKKDRILLYDNYEKKGYIIDNDIVVLQLNNEGDKLEPNCGWEEGRRRVFFKIILRPYYRYPLRHYLYHRIKRSILKEKNGNKS